MSEQTKDLVEVTKDYYDSHDADNFYYQIWGGEDIHVGLYDDNTKDIFEASHKSVLRMVEMLGGLDASMKVLDLGSGYGGAARFLAKTYGCPITCFNLSETENKRNREKTTAAGLNDLIDVVGGNFEELPFEDESFDILWCQDAILHSGRKEKVLEEAYRVLKSGGRLIFTDPMQANKVDQPELLKPILERIHLGALGSVGFYKEKLTNLGMKVLQIDEHPEQLTNHYSAVLHTMEAKESELNKVCSQAYIDRMKAGLGHWIKGGNSGILNWGFLLFEKP